MMMVVPEFVDLLTCCTVGLDHVTKHKKIFGLENSPPIKRWQIFSFYKIESRYPTLGHS